MAKILLANSKTLNAIVPDLMSHISLNLHGSGASLFLLPPSEGGAESYLANLCKVLNPNLKLHVFNNYDQCVIHSSSGNYFTDITYPNLARHYIEIIKTIQPVGPYNLFGWSFGGILGYEIACQLIRDGHQVQTLMLLDSIFGYKNIIVQDAIFMESSFLLDNLNYGYAPVDIGTQTQILLFKATEAIPTDKYAVTHDQDMISLLNHIVKMQPLNGLNYIMHDLSNIMVKNIKSNHIDWHTNNSVVDFIAREIELAIAKH